MLALDPDRSPRDRWPGFTSVPSLAPQTAMLAPPLFPQQTRTAASGGLGLAPGQRSGTTWRPARRPPSPLKEPPGGFQSELWTLTVLFLCSFPGHASEAAGAQTPSGPARVGAATGGWRRVHARTRTRIGSLTLNEPLGCGLFLRLVFILS